MKKTMWLTLIASSLLVFGACGAKEENEAGKETKQAGYPVTIKNYTREDQTQEWREKDQTFKEAPKHVLVNTKPAAELLLHLGLGDSIGSVGADFGVGDPTVEKEYQKLNLLSSDYISKETALSADPDAVIGRGGLFENEEWGHGSVEVLNEMKIPTYVFQTSLTDATFDDVYADIDHLGQIFNVKKQADKFKAELKEREEKVAEKLANHKEKQRFAYIHMSDPSEPEIYSAYGESFFNNMFEMAGLENVFKDVKGEVAIEALIEEDPDVIIVPDWSTYNSEAKREDMINGVLDNKKLSSLKAVKNKQVYAVDYNYMFGYGYQALTGIELLSEELYGE